MTQSTVLSVVDGHQRGLVAVRQARAWALLTAPYCKRLLSGPLVLPFERSIDEMQRY